jgi:hypothetical protein
LVLSVPATKSPNGPQIPNPRSPVPPTPLSKAPHFTTDLRSLAPGPNTASAPAGFPSLITADSLALFAEFRGRRFTLLWRGSRDGFGGHDFHGRCDGHAPTRPHPHTPTLALLQDTEAGNFGGSTPVGRESPTKPPYFKVDPSLKSFVFMQMNPHNFPARKYALNAEEKDRVTWHDSERGPHFWGLGGLAVLPRTTPSWTGKLFSLVRAISQCMKSKSSIAD